MTRKCTNCRLWPALLLAPLLAGCLGSTEPVPRDHFYRLVVPAPETGEEMLPGVLEVETLRADGLLRERPLLYSASGRSHEVQQHDYHYWADAPTRMLQDQMVAYLRRGGFARSVVTPEMRVDADYRLSGKAKRLERLVGGGPPRAVVELELVLVRIADERLLAVESYGEEVAATDAGVKAAVVALNQATARIFHRFLGGAMKAASLAARPHHAGAHRPPTKPPGTAPRSPSRNEAVADAGRRGEHHSSPAARSLSR